MSLILNNKIRPRCQKVPGKFLQINLRESKKNNPVKIFLPKFKLLIVNPFSKIKTKKPNKCKTKTNYNKIYKLVYKINKKD